MVYIVLLNRNASSPWMILCECASFADNPFSLIHIINLNPALHHIDCDTMVVAWRFLNNKYIIKVSRYLFHTDLFL